MSLSATRFALALALALGASSLALAQGERPLPPWDRPVSQVEARRVVGQVQQLVESSSQRDGRPALAALGDESWLVRQVAVIRLSVLELDPATCEELRKQSGPGSEPLPQVDPLRKKAAAHVATIQPDPQAPAEEIDELEAARLVCAVLSEQLSRKATPAAQRLRLVQEGLSYRHALKRKDRPWIGRQLLAWTDQAQALADLGFKTAKQAAADGGLKLGEWYVDNRAYLYWHPSERRFRLDLAARKAKTPSAEFREQTPWGEDEGPNERRESPSR